MRFRIFISTLFFAADLYGFTVSGTVTDKDSGKGIGGISVGIDVVNFVGKTDRDGKFIFRNIPPGYYILHSGHPLYGNSEVKIRVKRDLDVPLKLARVNFSMKKTVAAYNRLEERHGSQGINSGNIKDLPMRGAGDSLHLLQTLPGVGSGFNMGAVPVIRGLNPIYDKLYVDGIPIDFPYHYYGALVPVLSSISEAVIDEAEIIKGPYPLYYGNSIGSIINIKTKEADETGVHGKVFIDPILPLMPTVHLSIVPMKDLSILVTGRRTCLDWVIESVNEENEKKIYIQDYHLKSSYNLNSRHKLSIIAMGSDDYQSLDKKTQRSMYHVEAFKWDFLINRDMHMQTIMSLNNTSHYIEDENNLVSYDPGKFRLFQILNMSFGEYYLKSGYEFLLHSGGATGHLDESKIADIDFGHLLQGDGEFNFPMSGKSLSLFTEGGAEFRPSWLGKELWTQAGIRYNYYGPSSNQSLDFRFMAGMYLTDTFSIYGGGGGFTAHPHMYSYLGTESDNLEDSRSYNIVLGLKSRLLKNLTGQMEFYYNKYKNLSTGDPDLLNLDDYKTYLQINPFTEEESGFTTGAEFWLKTRYRNFYGWISYAISLSKRESSGYTESFYSDYDQTHLLKLVMSAVFDRWTQSIVWSYSTAMPYTPVSSYDKGTAGYYNVYNSERCDPHHRLDYKLNYTFESGTRIYFELWNFYGNTKNYLFEKSNGDMAADIKISDSLPIFLWLGAVICF